MPVTDRFRSQCRLLRIASLVVFTGLALLFALGLVGPPMWAPKAPGDAGTRFALAVVRFLPGLGYLWALWAVQRALRELGTGARAIVGYGVIAGALLSVFVVTNVTRLLLHHRGGFMYFDMSGIVLARRGMKARELAATVGISETQLSLFRSGKVKGIRFRTLAKLCAALDCAPGELLDYDLDPADLDVPDPD